MSMQFEPHIAERYGVDEAIMINNLSFWISHNRANNKHFYDGRYWTYNSVSAFAELFPFWTEKQLRRILTSLIDKKVLITGNYNKKKSDKTTWYSFANESAFLVTSHSTKRENLVCPNGQMASAQMGEPLPDNKTNTDNKQADIITDSDKSSSFVHKELVKFWLEEFHKGWNFNGIHGKSLKSLIDQIKKLLAAHGRVCGDQEVIDFFKKMCLSLPDWYKDKDLPTLNSKFNEIITEISHGKQSKQPKSFYNGDSKYNSYRQG